MTGDDSDATLARGIAIRRWGACDAVALLGQGANNIVFLAERADEMVAIKLSKPHREDGALGEYRKEAWCAAQAAARGVRTPQVLEIGTFAMRSFAVMEFARGRAPAAAQAVGVWRALGREARQINGIAVAGWGCSLDGAGVFGENWQGHLDYNIGALGPGDALRELGVLDASSSRRLRDVLERLRLGTFRFGLCHGDIALQNVLVDGDAKPWLLDWGCAFAHVVPHYEINEIVRDSKAAPDALAAFLGGYGISRADHAAMTPDLLALSALREVDTLRWAIDRKPDMIAEMCARAKAAVAKLE